MKLMDLFKRYSGRLRVAEANAIVVVESDGVKYEVIGATWGKHALILHAGGEVDTRYRPKTAQAIHERATLVMEAVANDLLPRRAE